MSESRRESELIMTDRPDGTKQLYHIALAREDGVPPNMLLVGEPDRAKIVASFFDRGIEGKAEHREFLTVWGHYKEVPVAVMGTGIGTDNTEIASVELHAMHEYDPVIDKWSAYPPRRNIIRVGTSASPQADVPLGSLGITSHAIGLDNVGLFYLHPGKKKVLDYRTLIDVYCTPNNPVARAILDKVRKEIWAATDGVIRPYVSTAAPSVVEALQQAAQEQELPLDSGVGAYTGITTSAPGFFGPQGRTIGRFGNIILPDLQDRLARIGVFDVEDDVTERDKKLVRATNNEMESSVLNRLNGEILGHNVGAVCLVIANRNRGEMITLEGYQEGVRRACQAALDAMVKLAA